MKDPWFFIKGFQPVSFCDWPGKVSSVLFVGGCNLRCPTCHNKILVLHHTKLPSIPKERIFFYLKNRKSWIDGVVISGGEPTLIDLKRIILDLKKEVDLPVKIDTNGLKPEVIEMLVEEKLVDLVAVDIKGPWRKYPELTGGMCNFELAKSSLLKIIDVAKRFPSRFYFRTTMVPLLSKEDVEEIKGYLPDEFKLVIQEYIEPKEVTIMEEDHVH